MAGGPTPNDLGGKAVKESPRFPGRIAFSIGGFPRLEPGIQGMIPDQFKYTNS